jgi:hypothetical protein
MGEGHVTQAPPPAIGCWRLFAELLEMEHDTWTPSNFKVRAMAGITARVRRTSWMRLVRPPEFPRRGFEYRKSQKDKFELTSIGHQPMGRKSEKSLEQLPLPKGSIGTPYV